jgi:carbonic anhydrase
MTLRSPQSKEPDIRRRRGVAQAALAVLLGMLVHGGSAGAESLGVPSHPESFDDAGCKGQRQSPVDLGAAAPADLGSLQFSYTPFAADLAHLGHTLQVSAQTPAAGGGFLTLNGTRFDFLQFHFHHPSEHALAGKRWPMELHLVHRAADGKLAVLGVMLRPGRENDGLANLLSALPRDGQKRALARPVNLAQFLPLSGASYHYPGSLTTPPCSEIVSWIVLRDPIEAGIGQIESLAQAFPMNARPLQPSAGRPIGLDLF